MPGTVDEVEEWVDWRGLSDMPEKHVQLFTLQAVETLVKESRRRERRQYLFNERLLCEMADLRGQVRALSAHSSPGFPRFRFLPGGIRDRIWSLALSRRIVRNVDPGRSLGSPLLRAPAISRVCQESRAVALRHGRYYTVKEEVRGVFQPDICDHGPNCH